MGRFARSANCGFFGEQIYIRLEDDEECYMTRQMRVFIVG